MDNLEFNQQAESPLTYAFRAERSRSKRQFYRHLTLFVASQLVLVGLYLLLVLSGATTSLTGLIVLALMWGLGLLWHFLTTFVFTNGHSASGQRMADEK